MLNVEILIWINIFPVQSICYQQQLRVCLVSTNCLGASKGVTEF